MRKLCFTIFIGAAALAAGAVFAQQTSPQPRNRYVAGDAQKSEDAAATRDAAAGTEEAAAEAVGEESTPADTSVTQVPLRRPSLRRDSHSPSLTPPSATPEMWFYEQERRRYEEPKAAVRRAAEFRTAQRQQRIESRKWYGYSNARPIASPNPWYDTYSPMWVGNSYYPYHWSGGAAVAVRPGWYGVGY